MAEFVLTDVSVTIGGTDLSDHITSLSLPVTVDEIEKQAFGDSWKERHTGALKDWTATINFNQDFAASEVDATIWPLLGTSAAFVGKPTSDAVSATNPSYSGNFLVSQYTPIDGAVGDGATVSVTWPGNGALTRGTGA